MNCGFVGCDAVCSGSWLPAFRVFRPFYHHVGHINLFSILHSDFSVWKLKKKVTCSSEMWVTTY
jgi:hypothetical protein